MPLRTDNLWKFSDIFLAHQKKLEFENYHLLCHIEPSKLSPVKVYKSGIAYAHPTSTWNMSLLTSLWLEKSRTRDFRFQKGPFWWVFTYCTWDNTENPEQDLRIDILRCTYNYIHPIKRKFPYPSQVDMKSICVGIFWAGGYIYIFLIRVYLYLWVATSREKWRKVI